MDYLMLIEITGAFLAKLFGLKKERKIEVAGCLDHIAETLGQLPARIRAGAKYEELAGLSQQASDYAASSAMSLGCFKRREITSFVALLEQAHSAKSALIDDAPAERDERLRVISEIAGSLRSAASQLPL